MAGEIRFENGAAYEHFMGKWSRLVGEDFLSWVAPAAGLDWLDVGCGNGAFTELLGERCAPKSLIGVDPSEAQLDYSRLRGIPGASFEQGEAMLLPFGDSSFDAAAMALVLFFVPDPARGVEEMKRVVKPGGTVCAYVWDALEPGGFPLSVMQEELKSLATTPMLPPRADISPVSALARLWMEAGLVNVRTATFVVSRTFRDFDDFWSTVEIALRMGDGTRELPMKARAALKARLIQRLPTEEGGGLVHTARANAVVGQVRR